MGRLPGLMPQSPKTRHQEVFTRHFDICQRGDVLAVCSSTLSGTFPRPLEAQGCAAKLQVRLSPKNSHFQAERHLSAFLNSPFDSSGWPSGASGGGQGNPQRLATSPTPLELSRGPACMSAMTRPRAPRKPLSLRQSHIGFLHCLGPAPGKTVQ